MGTLVEIFIDAYNHIINNSEIVGISLIKLPFLVIIINKLLEIRVLKQNLFLHKSLREFPQNRSKIIRIVKKIVDINWGNMNVHQRYIEMLFFDKRFDKAIVESKLVLDINPYNFHATLFLANGYFEVGLYEKCIEVCNGYLSISNNSFEFSDMKEKCELILEGEIKICDLK